MKYGSPVRLKSVNILSYATLFDPIHTCSQGLPSVQSARIAKDLAIKQLTKPISFEDWKHKLGMSAKQEFGISKKEREQLDV